MTIKMICPAETEENARMAREKLGEACGLYHQGIPGDGNE